MQAQKTITVVLGGHKWECELNFAKYGNGRTAIQLVDPEAPWEVIAVATINIPEEKLAADEIIVKNYSENEGLYEQLRDMGIISEAIRWVASGWITAPVCKLLIPVI